MLLRSFFLMNDVLKKLRRGIFCGMFGGLLALIFWQNGWLETWERVTWDWRVKLLAKPGAATDDIRLILLDQQSLDWAENQLGEGWPWPRQLYAVIINFCQRSGVKALGFDVLFTEFSTRGVDDDAALGEAIGQFRAFTGALILGEGSGNVTAWPNDWPTPKFALNGLEEWLATVNKPPNWIVGKALLPIPEVAKNATILSNVQQLPDSDGIYRHIPLLGLFNGNVFPSLGVGTYLAAASDTAMRIAPGMLTIGAKRIAIDRNGEAILRYRGATGTHKSYRVQEILEAEARRLEEAPASERDLEIARDLRGKYALFGFSAPGLKDLRATPVSATAAGVEINATVLDNLLANDFLADLPVWMSVAFLCVVVMTCGTLAFFLSDPFENAIIGVVFLAIPVLLALWAYQRGFWMPLAAQEMGTTATILAALLVNYATEGRQRRFLKAAFRQYLSPTFIEQLIQHPERLKLGGERREISIFFSDIQGFTSISERLQPEELTAFLNEYLSAMTDIIHEEGGTIDKYEGDAIIAFWNAPVELPDHAEHVVRAALRCQQKLAEMRPALKAKVGRDVFMRVGVNTGFAVVGNMGSRTRFDYTMLGDSVNLASRLEGVNKEFGTYCMISQFTKDKLPPTAFALRELARVAVVGRHEPVTVYEPMFLEEHAAWNDIFATFHEGLSAFYDGRLQEAINIFGTIKELDPAAAAYLKKSQEFLLSPLPADWRGVWVMTSK